MPVFNNILAGASGSAGGAAAGDFKIERSLRFDANATSYLSREFAQGNQKKWTWSAWVKRSKLVDNNYLALFTAPVGGSGNDGIFFRNNALSLSFGYAGSGIECYTSSVFNDPSAWYHICVSVNTDETTAADRIRVWVNNKLQTLNQYPGPGATAGIGAATKHHLGVWRRGSSTNYAFDGYMADVNYLDGIAITSPEGVFGNYSSTTGAWDPIRYTGSYNATGTNYDSLLTVPGGFASGEGADKAFDGQTSTRAKASTTDDIITFDLSSLNLTGSFEFWATNASSEYSLDGGSTWTSSLSSQYTTATSDISGVSNIKFKPSSGTTMKITAFRNQGNVLVSTTPSVNGFHLDFSSTTQFTHPNKYVTQSGSATPPSNASTLTYNTGNYFGGNQGVTYDAGSVRRFYVQPGSADPTVKTSNDGTTWTTVFDGSVGWNDPVEVNCRYVYMSSSGNGFGPYFRQPAFVADSSGNNNHFVDGNIFEVKTPATTAHRYWRVVIYGYTSHWPRMSSLELYEADGTQRTHTNFTSDNCSDQGEIPDEGEVFDADYTNNYNFTNVGVYSTYNGGTRIGRADVYYSDDNIRWTYSFTSVVSNNASCGIQVGTVAETDVFVDSPTNYDDGTNIGGNYATLNPLNPSTNAGTYTNGNLDFTRGSGYGTATSTIGMTSGKWYCEVTRGTGNTVLGILDQTITADYLDRGSGGYGYRYDGTKVHNNQAHGNIGGYNSTDIVGLAFDADASVIYFYKNGNLQGSFANVTTAVTDSAWFFAFSAESTTISVNFGQRPFSHLPTGFKALCTQNFDDPTITKPSEHFDVVTYDGTGQAQAITGLNFQPDIAWIKERNGTSWHRIIDSVRGQKELFPNDDNTEVSFSQGVNSFTSDGFNLGTGSDSNVNTNSKTYVGWLWKAATSFSNGSGSNGATLASSGKVNQAAGISIVTYSYTGTSQYSYVHGLNVKPNLVIRKARNLTESWSVYHSAMGFDERSNLDNTNASSGTTTFRSDQGDPTSTLNYINNNNTSNVLEYVFTAVPGFSAFGRYEGTGTNDGPFIFTGFKPRFILLKNVDNYGTGYDWFIHDTKRDPYNVSDSYIKASQADTEQTYNMLDILSNGFKLRNNLGSYNQASHTHVWAAFAENPFKYARAR
jgi:hypothetical protein